MSLYLIYTYNIYRKKRRRGGKGWKMLADRAGASWIVSPGRLAPCVRLGFCRVAVAPRG